MEPALPSAAESRHRRGNLRGATLWTAAILLALGLAWFVGAVAVPFGRAWVEVKAYDQGRGGPYYENEAELRRLLIYLRAPRWLVPRRAAAVEMLGGSSGEIAVPSLVALLSDGEPEVRAAAAKALGDHADEAVIPHLRKALADRDEHVRAAAGLALEWIRFNAAFHKTRDRSFCSGFMYWASPCPLLTRDWLLVAGGTVEAKRDDDEIKGIQRCRIKLDKVFLADRARPEMKDWGEGKDYLNCDAANDVNAGDKVVVFVNEYDNGTGILPTLGSNCSIGIRVADWNEEIVRAVEAVCRSKDRKAALQDPQVQKAWRRFDDIGVDAVLQGKSYHEILEWWEARSLQPRN